ncbi:uncharacterized protein LOC117331916 [Pecten maximus]|uniref:uncharacterized protein LOC117331916 n=1 Tax=Pecten maximus TaxID=6579 RepID=UPI0014588A5C|nr:uncharacterized protein LOC117331916 [Pecten maximus]
MSRSHEHTKALNDLAQHTGDNTNDRLERLKKIEKLRLQGYQKLRSLTGEKSGTPISPTRRSYSNFSSETSPSVYGSLGRINHLGGVKPKSYSSQSYQTEPRKTRSSSLSDEEGDYRPKHLLRSRSATTVSDAALSAFESTEQNMSNPTGAVDEYWKEGEDSYNEDDENIEDFKRSLFGDIGAYTNKTSPRTDGTLQSFSLSRAWSSGGADYDDPSLKGGDSRDATEDSGVDISMFPSYDPEFLGMNYGETFENPHNGSTIRKSFSRDRGRQPLLRSFSSQQESVQGSGLSSIDYTDPKISRLDSMHLTDKFSANQERQKRIESALDNLFSSSRASDESTSVSSDRRVYERGGSRTMSSTTPRYSDRYTSKTDSYSLSESSYTQRGLSSRDYTARNAPSASLTSLPSERKKIGISTETERKLEELFNTPATISNRPAFTSRSLRTETPSIRNRSDQIVITRRRTEDPNVRKLSSGSILEQKRDESFRIPDVLSTRMLDNESYGSAPRKDPGMRNTSAQSTLDKKLDNLFAVPDVLSTNVPENKMYETAQDTISSRTEGYDFDYNDISEDVGTVSAQSSLDQKLDSLFGSSDIHSTKIRENKNYETVRNKVSSRLLNSKEKPTLSSMLYGTENKSMELEETTPNGQQRETKRKRHQGQQAIQQSYTNGEDSSDGSEMSQQPNPAVTTAGSEVITGSVDVDMSKNEDTVKGENTESFDQEHSAAVETMRNVEVGLEYEQTKEDDNTENSFRGDSIVINSSKLEESRSKADLLQGNKTEDILFHHNEQQSQSSEMVNVVQELNIIERNEAMVTEQQKATNGKQTESKKGKKKSKGKKSKGKKGQKNIEKVAEKEITKKVPGKPVLETDIDFPLAEDDKQDITKDCENEETQISPSEDKIGGITESIQMVESKIQTRDKEIYIQAENKEEEEKYIQAENKEEEEKYIQAEESSQTDIQAEKEVYQISAEVLEETPTVETNVESETVINSKSTIESHEAGSGQEQTSWLRSKFNSLLHGFSADSSETRSDVQQTAKSIDMVSGNEESISNGDVNGVTFSDTGTLSEDDFATASDDSTAKHSDHDYDIKYRQSVLDANIKNEKKSTETSDESDTMDIFSELAATTGMSLDIDEQNSVDMEGHVVYKREEELLRYEKEDTPGQMPEFDGEEDDVKQQEMYMQSEESVCLYDEFIAVKEMDLKDEENNNESKKLGVNQIQEIVPRSDTSVQMNVVCTTEISIQTEMEACLTADKVSAHVQTLPLKVDKWTQTDTQLAPDSKEFGIQASPATADHSAQYNVSVRENGTQIVNELDTNLDLDQLKTEYFDQGKPEGKVLLEQVKSKLLSSEQVELENISCEQIKREQIKHEHHSSEQIKLEHLSSKQEEHRAVLKVDPVRIVTDKLTPEYAVAEEVKHELVAPEQVKLGGGQLSNTTEDVSVIVESKEDTVINEHPTESSVHTKEKLSAKVDCSTAEKEDSLANVSIGSTTEKEDSLTNVSIQNSIVTKIIQSVEGHTTTNTGHNTMNEDHTTTNETMNTWSNISAASEITFTSQGPGKKVPPQTLPKRRTKHGSTRPSSRPSSIVSEGDGYDFHTSGQNTASLESSRFNFNKILQKTDTTDAEMPSDKGHGIENVKTIETVIAKSTAPGPLSPGKVPTGSSSTLLTMTVGPTSPRAQERNMDTKESTMLASSNVTSPRSSLSGMASLGSHSNKGNVKSPPPALLPKRKATSQLQMPTSPKSPTSPRTTEKMELVQECNAVFAKQMKMNNGKQEIVKEPLNRLKDNPFIRKDVNVKVGQQESFSKKCEISTSSKPRTLSSSLNPKSPKDERKGTGDLTVQTDVVKHNVLDKKGTTRDMAKVNKDDAVDLSVLDSRSLRSEIIRQSSSRLSARNIAKKTKKVDSIRSKLETSTDSSGRNETSSLVNKIISDAAKFEAKFSSGLSPNDKEEVSSKTFSEQAPLERENPFIQPTADITFSRKVSSDFNSGEEKSVYVETSFDGDEVQTSTVSQTGQIALQMNDVRQEAQPSEGIQLDTKVLETRYSTVMQTDKKGEQENKVEPPKRKLMVQIPPPEKTEEGLELVPDSPSLASLVSSKLEDIGMGEIATAIEETKTNLKSDQQKAAKPPSPKTAKPPSPKTGKPPSPKTTKTPPPRRNRPLSPKVGKTPPSPQNSKSPKLTIPSSPRGGKSTSGSTPQSPGGKPLSPRKGQSPLSKAMFGDRESGQPGSEISGDSMSGRRSSEKTGSNSSRASSVSSEGSYSAEKGKSARQESSKSRQKGSKENPSVPDKSEGQKGTKKAPPVPEKPKRTTSLKKDTPSHLKDTESSAFKSKGKSGFSFLKGRKSSK